MIWVECNLLHALMQQVELKNCVSHKPLGVGLGQWTANP